jgi:hypothetical protein
VGAVVARDTTKLWFVSDSIEGRLFELVLDRSVEKTEVLLSDDVLVSNASTRSQKPAVSVTESSKTLVYVPIDPPRASISSSHVPGTHCSVEKLCSVCSSGSVATCVAGAVALMLGVALLCCSSGVLSFCTGALVDVMTDVGAAEPSGRVFFRLGRGPCTLPTRDSA